MKKAIIDINKWDFATGCQARLSCPQGAIKRGINSYKVDEEKCNGCGVFIYACPNKVISLS